MDSQRDIAEKCLLGSIVLASSAYWATCATIRPEMFSSSAHRSVWRAAADIYETTNTTQLDPVVLRDKIGDDAGFKGAGKLLVELMETVPHADNADHYAAMVVEAYKLDEAKAVIGGANIDPGDVDASIAQIQKRLEQIQTGTSGTTHRIGDLTDDWAKSLFDKAEGGGTGLPTGWMALDEMTSGLRGNELIVLAARPGQGKTAFVGNMLAYLCRKSHAAWMCSLEMATSELIERFVGMLSRVDNKAMRQGTFAEIDEFNISEALAEINRWPLFIDDTAGQTITSICGKARAQHARNKIKLIVIDYLQLIEPDDRKMPREQQVSEFSRKLKLLAKALKVPVIALAQLNREAEKGKPKLAHLRESGAIEQDADQVWFLHSPEAADKDDRPGETDLIIAKNRHGPCGEITFRFDRKFGRFRDNVLVTDETF